MWTPGYMLVGRALKALDVIPALRIGAMGHSIQSALWALSDKSWHFYALLPFGWLRFLCATALDVHITQQATAGGMGKAELRGALGNVQQLVNVAAPLFWANVFSSGVRRESRGAYYGVMFVVAAANALLSFSVGGSGE
jgi:hypothetical protein